MFVMRRAIGATPSQMLTTSTSSSTTPTRQLQRRNAANSGADVQATPIATRTTTVSQPQVTPCDQAVCRNGYAAWRARHPELRSCFGGAGSHDERTYVYMCCAQQTGTTTASRFTESWNALVGQRNCPPPPVTDAPPPMPPPPTPDDNYDEPMEIPVEYPEDGPGGDTAAEPVSHARVWGPIVGIGLLAAVALTLARKRKLTSKRRRR